MRSTSTGVGRLEGRQKVGRGRAGLWVDRLREGVETGSGDQIITPVTGLFGPDLGCLDLLVQIQAALLGKAVA